MAVIYNAKGTSYPSFTIGKQGVTVLQGAVAPIAGQGVNGDIYFQSGATPAMWQKIAGAWTKLGSVTSKIFTGTTSVDTGEVADTITLNVTGTRIASVAKDALAVNGEKLEIKNGASTVKLTATDTSGTNAVDVLLVPQGAGVVKVQSTGESAISNTDGGAMQIKPGDKTVGAGGSITIQGGTTSATGAAGGDVILKPGTSGPTGAVAQVKLPTGYVGISADSVVSKTNVMTRIVSTVTTQNIYTITATDQVILVNRTTSVPTSIVLPSSGVVAGRTIIVKDAKGDADSNTITVSVDNSSNIDGTTSSVITSSFGKQTFIFDGTKWFTI